MLKDKNFDTKLHLISRRLSGLKSSERNKSKGKFCKFRIQYYHIENNYPIVSSKPSLSSQSKIVNNNVKFGILLQNDGCWQNLENDTDDPIGTSYDNR